MRELITAARYPAPYPLSMLTTAMPGEQLLSIPSSAANPPKLAPYPTLVGTAITGAAISPATTLGSAPSIPATTMTTLAARSCPRQDKRRCRSRHADVVQLLRRLAHHLQRPCRFLGDGKIAGSRCHQRHPLRPRRGQSRSSQMAQGAGVILNLGHKAACGVELLLARPRPQRARRSLRQRQRNLRHLRRRLAGAIDHFRKPPPDRAMMINSRMSQILKRQHPKRRQRFFPRPSVAGQRAVKTHGSRPGPCCLYCCPSIQE